MSKGDGRRLHTPSRTLLLYFGSSLACLLDAAKQLGMEPTEGFYTASSIPPDANVFRINSFEVSVLSAVYGVRCVLIVAASHADRSRGGAGGPQIRA